MHDEMIARIAYLNNGLPEAQPKLLDGIRYGIGIARKHPALAADFADDLDRRLVAIRNNEPLELLETRIQTILDYIVHGEDQ
jgi:hypothetical protein